MHAGLGMFEYLQLADELDAIPIWVANNGVAHRVCFSALNMLA